LSVITGLLKSGQGFSPAFLENLNTIARGEAAACCYRLANASEIAELKNQISRRRNNEGENKTHAFRHDVVCHSVGGLRADFSRSEWR
jgi:hypothetical protein